MFTYQFRWRAPEIVLSTALAFLPAVASAQRPEGDSGEISAIGGIAGGSGLGVQPTVAGSAGYAFSKWGMALFDTSFIPMGNHTIQSWPAPADVRRSWTLDFGMDIHIRIPVKARWEPYGIAGAGCLWNSLRANAVDLNGLAVERHFSQVNGALHTGGGFRYYVRESWGIRSEVKVIVSKQIYTQMLMGVFYVTPPNWP